MKTIQNNPAGSEDLSHSFTQPEALIVAAAASRIFPSDETGPGAQEAGVAVYIDRQLAGPWAMSSEECLSLPRWVMHRWLLAKEKEAKLGRKSNKTLL